MSEIGWVDAITDTNIAGWAADDSDFQQPVSVDVIVNSELVATVPCVTFREDLRAAGIGDGCKGFEFDPCRYLRPGRNQLVVRYSRSEVVVPKGCASWVRWREGVAVGEGALIAALEAYYEFKPESEIVAVGSGARDLECVFRKSKISFHSFTSSEDLCGTPEADVVVCLGLRKPPAEILAGILERTRTPGLAVIGLEEISEAVEQCREMMAQRGGPDVRFESVRTAQGKFRTFAFLPTGMDHRTATQTHPVLAHIHVPKCSGTSLRVLMERHFGPRHLRLYVDDTYFVYGDETLRNYLLQNSEIQGFSSHHVRSFPRWLGGREILYITFLRDPVEQFVSYMTHFRMPYSQITSKSLLEAVPADANKLTLREFARWLLTQDRDVPFRENHNVRFFTRHSSPAAADQLASAKATLERFFFVGITDRMDKSIEKLRARVQAAGLDFPQNPMPMENISKDYRDDLSWIHPDDEVGSLLLRSIEKDRQLYEWGLEQLEK